MAFERFLKMCFVTALGYKSLPILPEFVLFYPRFSCLYSGKFSDESQCCLNVLFISDKGFVRGCAVPLRCAYSFRPAVWVESRLKEDVM